jgi:transcriptional regulator with XRE-family HTH domain
MDDLPNRIREHRAKKGLTLDDLAARVGTSNQQIQRLETGKRKLTADWLQRISAALDVEISSLLKVSPTNSKMIAENITSLADQLNLLTVGAGNIFELLGVSPEDIELAAAGKIQLGREVLDKVSEVESTIKWAKARIGQNIAITLNQLTKGHPPDEGYYRVGEGFVPLYGEPADAERIWFQLDRGPVGYIARPPALKGNSNGFAVRIVGQGAAPRYDQGEEVYVDPGLKPGIDSDVLIAVADSTGNEQYRCIIGRLLSDGDTLTLLVYGTGEHLEFESSAIVCRFSILRNEHLIIL